MSVRDPRPQATQTPCAFALAALLALPGAASAADEIHWTMTSPTSVTVDWRGGGPTVRYGLTTDYGLTALGRTPSIKPISSAGPFWEARISGLEPGVNYHYSVDGGPDHVFHGLPVPDTIFTVFVEGDIGSSIYRSMTGVQALIASAAPSFVIGLGDLTYGADHGPAAIDQHFNDVMVWSQDAAYMPIWGNHDWGDTLDDLRNYKGRFDLPESRSSPGAPDVSCCNEDWYWFDAGNVRFIAYPEPYPGAWPVWAEGAEELMDQAEANSRIRFIVTFGHRPAYSSGSHPGSGTLRGMLDSLGARHPKYVLNLSGHSHNYERTHPMSGVTHVTVGIGGSTLGRSVGDCGWGGGCPPPAWSAFRAFHHGALRLDIGPYGIHGQVLCGPATQRDDITCEPGEVFDSFSLGGDAAPRFHRVPGNLSVAVGSQVKIEVAVSDPNGDRITGLVADFQKFPPGGNQRFTVDRGDTTGRFTWTPRPRDVGEHVVTFRASNELAAAASTAIDVHSVLAIPDLHTPVLALNPIRPSPAGRTFMLDYSLADGGEARLEILDVAGRVARRIALDNHGPGRHEMVVHAGPELAAGVYWLRLRQSGRAVRQRLVLLRP